MERWILLGEIMHALSSIRDGRTYAHVRLMAEWSANVQLVVNASSGQKRSRVLTSGRAQRLDNSSQ